MIVLQTLYLNIRSYREDDTSAVYSRTHTHRNSRSEGHDKHTCKQGSPDTLLNIFLITSGTQRYTNDINIVVRHTFGVL